MQKNSSNKKVKLKTNSLKDLPIEEINNQELKQIKGGCVPRVGTEFDFLTLDDGVETPI